MRVYRHGNYFWAYGAVRSKAPGYPGGCWAWIGDGSSSLRGLDWFYVGLKESDMSAENRVDYQEALDCGAPDTLRPPPSLGVFA